VKLKSISRDASSDVRDMVLRFFNTLTQRKEEFVPLEQGKVRMYTCGPTVYDFAHIGNFRTYVFQDVLRRWLEYRGYKIIQVMNLTDVDDKTIRDSKKEGIPLGEFTEKYTKAFFDDIAKLNIERAEVYPRATEHIPEMVELIKRLIQKGFAYKSEGSIYFDTTKFREYGKLSKVKIEDLKTSARVKVDSYARGEARDFALWKGWDEDDGDVFWETELGKGRPGWHIECSAMSMKYLGETLDIHSGGVDLIFPHHENEIAQSEAATGKKFANYWLHSEFLMVNGKKMSKSLKNFYTLRDILERGYDPRAIRYVLLSTHYRRPLNFTFEELEAAERTLERLTDFLKRLEPTRGKVDGDQKVSQLVKEARERFEEAMDDDLDINTALAAVFDFIREMNRLMAEATISEKGIQEARDLVTRLDKVLGVLAPSEQAGELSEEEEKLIQARETARKNRDWGTADQIRSELRKRGLEIEDTPQGLRWRRVRQQEKADKTGSQPPLTL
jgi:cysteinyl-tRNA synthetase